jgi:hypothetical protein
MNFDLLVEQILENFQDSTVSFLIEYDEDGKRKHSIVIPTETAKAIKVYNPYHNMLEVLRFYRENDPNFSDETHRVFKFQTYDKNEIQFLKDEEDGDVWMNNPGDLKQLLHRVVTFGFSFGQLKEMYFPNLTEKDYKWLQSLG